MMPGGCGRAPRAADTRPGESAENTSAVHRGRRRTDDQRVQKKMPPVLPRMPQGRTCAEAADASLRTRQEKKTAGLPSALADLMKRVQSCLNIRNSLGIIAPGTTDRTAPEPRFRHLRWHQTAFPVIVAQLPEPAAAPGPERAVLRQRRRVYISSRGRHDPRAKRPRPHLLKDMPVLIDIEAELPTVVNLARPQGAVCVTTSVCWPQHAAITTAALRTPPLRSASAPACYRGRHAPAEDPNHTPNYTAAPPPSPPGLGPG